jgi:hypothetical protein
MDDRIRVTIECTRDQLAALVQACDTSFRIALGQFGEVAEVHAHRFDEGWADLRDRVEAACKAILMPGFHPTGHSFGIGSKEVGKTAHTQYVWWKLFGGGTKTYPDPFTGKPSILNYTGVPQPDVIVEPI